MAGLVRAGAGEFVNGKRHGFGVQEFANGERYEVRRGGRGSAIFDLSPQGFWKNGVRSGKGRSVVEEAGRAERGGREKKEEKRDKAREREGP